MKEVIGLIIFGAVWLSPFIITMLWPPFWELFKKCDKCGRRNALRINSTGGWHIGCRHCHYRDYDGSKVLEQQEFWLGRSIGIPWASVGTLLVILSPNQEIGWVWLIFGSIVIGISLINTKKRQEA